MKLQKCERGSVGEKAANNKQGGERKADLKGNVWGNQHQQAKQA